MTFIAEPGAGLEIWVYSCLDNATLLAKIVTYQTISFQDMLSDVGSGSVTITDNGKGQLPTSVFAEENIWQIVWDGKPVFAFVAENVNPVSGPNSDQEVDWTIAGRGVSQWLDKMQTYPTALGVPNTNPYLQFTSETYAKIIDQLLTQAQTRGVATWITKSGWTDTQDSHSSAWTDSNTVQVQVGTSLLSVLQQYATLVPFDWHMSPQGGLSLWKSAGSNLTAAIKLQPNRRILDWDSTADSTNVWDVVLLETANAEFLEVHNPSFISTWNRRETFVSVQSVANNTDATNYANALLNAYMNTNHEVIITIDPSVATEGSRPYFDFNVGDTIGVEFSGVNTEITTGKILGIAISSGNGPQIQCQLTLNYSVAIPQLQDQGTSGAVAGTPAGTLSPGITWSAFDAIVDSSLTPNPSNGIYATPFAAIAGCAAKGLNYMTIAVVDRGSVYTETASVTLPNTVNGIRIVGIAANPTYNPGSSYITMWNTASFICSTGSTHTAFLYLENISLTDDGSAASRGGIFVGVIGVIVVNSTINSKLLAGSGNTGSVNSIYSNSWLNCVFGSDSSGNGSQDGTVYLFDCSWQQGYGAANQTQRIKNVLVCIGTRFLAANTGLTITWQVTGSGRGTGQLTFSGCTYEDPTASMTWTFGTTTSQLVLDVTSTGVGLTVNVTQTSLNLVIRGHYGRVIISSSSGSQGMIDADFRAEGNVQITGGSGAGANSTCLGRIRVSCLCNSNALVTLSYLSGLTIELALATISTGSTGFTVLAMTGLVQNNIRVALSPNAAYGAGVVPYSFDATSAKNILDYAGASCCTSLGVDSGAGDLIRTT